MATVAVDPTYQSLRAREQANRVRSVRAQLKRAIASGSLSASGVFDQCPREAEGMTVRELVLSQPRCARSPGSRRTDLGGKVRFPDRFSDEDHPR
jgi:hypothetical protein